MSQSANAPDVDGSIDCKEPALDHREEVLASNAVPTDDQMSERKLKWKLDLFILPLIASIYFFASMVS
jgi:hypothetical protein